MDFLISTAYAAVRDGRPLEIVTGNNDADAVYFLQWLEREIGTGTADAVRPHLVAWGGNSAGIGVANIDPQGAVHPDTYWSGYTIGNVKDTPFSELWTGSDPKLAGLRQVPRPLKGRCGACAYKSICGGNTRIRALQLTGDPWEEDPACYLSNEEIGIGEAERRIAMVPFRGKSHDPAHRLF
jgi:radical SAM protein with 4Fe4S-binding SPASM domain